MGDLSSPEVSPASAYLIVGLGNPGREYQGTRHNAGFQVLDRLAARLGVSFSRLESKALVTKAEHQSRKLVLAKPQTYMNLSGQAVSSLARYYKIPIENVLVIFDDVDLPQGTLRLRSEGGSGGQKGVASIADRLGTQEFPRLRVGIGRPPGRMDAAAYVLQRFSASEMELMSEVLDRAAEAVLRFVVDGIHAAMNEYNGTIVGD